MYSHLTRVSPGLWTCAACGTNENWLVPSGLAQSLCCFLHIYVHEELKVNIQIPQDSCRAISVQNGRRLRSASLKAPSTWSRSAVSQTPFSSSALMDGWSNIYDCTWICRCSFEFICSELKCTVPVELICDTFRLTFCGCGLCSFYRCRFDPEKGGVVDVRHKGTPCGSVGQDVECINFMNPSKKTSNSKPSYGS